MRTVEPLGISYILFYPVVMMMIYAIFVMIIFGHHRHYPASTIGNGTETIPAWTSLWPQGLTFSAR